MDAGRDDMELSELFRNRLENAEVVPDPSVNARLMRKLARREFVSFNPARFNVYYLGAIVAAGLTAAILLLPDKDPAGMQPVSNTGIRVTATHDEKVQVPESVMQSPSGQAITADSKINATGSESKRNRPAAKEHREKDNLQVDKTAVAAKVSANDLIKTESAGTKRLAGDVNGMNRFVTSVSEGCAPLKVGFVNVSNSVDSCRWSFGDGGTASGKKVEWIFDVDGEYKVTMEAYSGGKLSGTATGIIKVYPVPAARFETYPEKPAIPDDDIRFINYSADAVKYLWDFGDGTGSGLFEPLHRYDKYDSYDVSLVAVNEYGCADSMVVRNAFAASKYYIDFPNAFIPNPDGPSGGYYNQKSDESAQVFHPSYLGVAEYQLKIFSKMGILIFESNDVNIGWDGYFKGQLGNSGVYIWKVRGKYRNGQTFTKMGDVTLLKY